MRIAICGGTFDPFHRGHLDPILAVRNKMSWNRVVYVPAFRQPFKLDQRTASGFHRFAMAVLATERHDDFLVSPIELERGEVSYSVDTIEAMHDRYPGAILDWVIGEDNVGDLSRWHRVDRIFQLANFVVLTRTGAAGEQRGSPAAGSTPAEPGSGSETSAGAVIYARNETVPVSSTEIRRRVRTEEPIEGFVDPLVARYIHHNGLYREAHT
jgi:nicotinate-nucleotide adenylyltransferase